MIFSISSTSSSSDVPLDSVRSRRFWPLRTELISGFSRSGFDVLALGVTEWEFSVGVVCSWVTWSMWVRPRPCGSPGSSDGPSSMSGGERCGSCGFEGPPLLRPSKKNKNYSILKIGAGLMGNRSETF